MSMQVEEPKTSRSLMSTLAFAFLGLSLAVLVIAIGIEMVFNVQTQQEAIAGRQQFIAQDAANTVASFIQEKFGMLETAAKLGDPTSTSQEEQMKVLGNLLGLEPAFGHLVLLDSQEHELAKVTRLSQATLEEFMDQAGSDLFAQVRQGDRYISSVYVDDVTSEPKVVMAVPATDAFGDFQGILVAEVNLKFMWELEDRLVGGEAGLEQAAPALELSAGGLQLIDQSRLPPGQRALSVVWMARGGSARAGVGRIRRLPIGPLLPVDLGPQSFPERPRLVR